MKYLAKTSHNVVKLCFTSLTVLMAVIAIPACSSTEIVRANSTPPMIAKTQPPIDLYMDIGIMPLEPGIPEGEEALENSLIIPDVRRAEARYIAYQLKDTLELTGNWGAVRVIPQFTEAVDILITGKILDSNGEELKLQVTVADSTGQVWLSRTFTDTASKYSYEAPKEDPFQDIYNDVANAILIYRQKLDEPELAKIKQVSNLRYAIRLSPEAFGGYLTESKGSVQIEQLPASNDQMLVRVNRIKEREYLFVDTLDDYYGNFFRDMKASYHEWRYATYDEAVAAKRLKKESMKRLIGGAAVVAAGVAASASKQSNTYASQAAGLGVVGGGIGLIKSGLSRRQRAEVHENALKEISESLGAEITPYVLDIEGRTIELTGTADVQYEEWREILKQIYIEETGLPARKDR
ncbi:hypothetical protein N9W97_06855 [Pseudomonadales bacterium]|jgi:hypothetical protein|nr:hypothetical protein [Pseudomonadales bacterium]MDB3990030.1 hypothetical protein [Pseudomonadales bacterium]MDC0892852.1 hypothetical protein [Pseudomonadales bacterium]|tara:strand:- start:225 stop:1448 length:1224 start_codon:yes stop_codon:yes gene_type:complete